jgi:large subunit ribosomal protein L30
MPNPLPPNNPQSPTPLARIRKPDMATTNMTANKTIKIEQTGSPIRRTHDQRETLVGLGLNRIGRIAEVPDTPSTRGMIAKVAHLIRVVEQK